MVGGGINSGYTKEVRSIGIGQRKNRSGDDFQVFGLASWIGVCSLFLLRERNQKERNHIGFLPQDS